MIKTLIYNLPPLEKNRPPLSGAILASVCKKEGHNCHVVDLQVNLDKFLKQRNIDVEYFSDVFYEHASSFTTDQIDLLNEFITEELKLVAEQHYDYILISLFSYLAQTFGELFLPQLRKLTKAKIVIGGAGILTRPNFLDNLTSDQIIDDFILGEAEEILPIYFRHGTGPGISNRNFKQIDNLDLQPWPDYSFYDLTNYHKNEQKELVIIGSRGCVRSCTFCDVAATSPKYRYRSGQDIANEIIHHYEVHGITDYYFADSLVNGSYKAFNDLCNGLASYNFDKPITWSGQYIIRSKSTTPKTHFEMLKASGCQTLFIGIESGCDRIRFELGKKFTNDDIEYYLENFERYEIETLFLFFTGYVSETEKDHKETLAMFKRWQRYVATGTIQGIETLNVLSVLPGAPLEKIAIENKFLFLQDHNGQLNLRSWINPQNPGFDFKERVKRHISMMEEAMRYKWPLWNGQLAMRLYEQSIDKFVNTPKTYVPLVQSF
jgi:anaerobic magnesium-protoporphyrin IX monomethyl ester cyclase